MGFKKSEQADLMVAHYWYLMVATDVFRYWLFSHGQQQHLC